MNRKDTNDACRRSLVSTDDGRASKNNVYSIRARQQENAARLALYPVLGHVSNVRPIRSPDPEPPRAA
jgi:hypothetical protein